MEDNKRRLVFWSLGIVFLCTIIYRLVKGLEFTKTDGQRYFIYCALVFFILVILFLLFLLYRIAKEEWTLNREYRNRKDIAEEEVAFPTNDISPIEDKKNSDDSKGI